MGLLFLTLSAVFSLSVAQVLKLVEVRSLRVLNVLVINYLVAVVISIVSTDWNGFEEHTGLIPILIHSAILGFLFIANFMIYSKSIDKNGMGISIAAMRMSLVFPILLSLMIYNEDITTGLILGILLSFISLILLVPFFFAFLTGSVVLLVRGQFNFKIKELVYGVLLGVVNLYSSYFILLALKEIPGSVVFPLVNLSIVFAGTFIGVIFWKDRPEKRQWIGLALASISIFLLVA